MLQGWCWWIAVWVVLKGLGEGSWDAAPLSDSRDLSSGWAHQSSLGKVSSGISEIMELGIGKGDAVQGRLQSTAQTAGEAGGAGRDREFTLYPPCRRHTARGLPEYTGCHTSLSPGSAELSAQPERGSAPSPRAAPDSTCRGVRQPWLLGTGCPDCWGQAALWHWIRRVWLPEAWPWNWLSHWLLPAPALEEQAEPLPEKSATKSTTKSTTKSPSPAQGRAFLHRQAEEEKWGGEWCWTLNVRSPNPREMQRTVRRWKLGSPLKRLSVLSRPLLCELCQWGRRKWENARVRKHICRICFLLSLTVLGFLRGFMFSVPARSACQLGSYEEDMDAIGSSGFGDYGKWTAGIFTSQP